MVLQRFRYNNLQVIIEYVTFDFEISIFLNQSKILMKRLLVFLFLSISCFVLHAQDEGGFYKKAYYFAGKQQVDSAFLYIDSLVTRFGHDDLDLYFNLTTNPRYRNLHKDACWSQLMDILLKAKHEVEDTLELQCQQNKDITKKVMPEAQHYDIHADINVKQKTLKVDGTVKVNFHGRPYIDFALWKYSSIDEILVNDKKSKIDFTPESKFQWMDQADRLRIYRTNTDKATIRYIYTSRLDSIDAWMSLCDSNLVMLSMYMPWYPHNPNSGHFNGDITFKIDPNFKVTGSGLISRKGNEWVMHQPWEGFDFGFIASPDLKRRIVKNQGKSIEIDYLSFEESDIDSLANACQAIFNYYSTLYQVVPEAKKLKVVLLPDIGGAISRRNYIVAEAYFFNEYLFKLLAHEIGHFWWQYATTENWLDWMNESFAEYSSLRAIQRHYGKTIFTDYIKAYKESVRKVCPILGLDRNAPNAHTVFYNKGAILLYDLQNEVGENRFFKFMHALAKSHAATHLQLIKIAKSTLGGKWAEWIQARLQE